MTMSRRRHHGLTLMEMLIAMSIMTVIVAGLSSAVVMTTNALPSPSDPVTLQLQADDALRTLVEELQMAQYVTSHSPTQVNFVIADRTGDAIPERIVYAWSGTAGDPLTRSFNGSAPSTVAADVQQFTLAFDTLDVDERFRVPPVETQLFAYDAPDSLADAAVEYDTSWWGQYFVPTLPAGTTEWSITRVALLVRDGSGALPTTVDLRVPAGDGTPSATTVDTYQLDTSALTGGYEWVDIPFSNATGLTPGAGMSIAITNTADRTAHLQYKNSSVTAPNLGLTQGTPAWGPLATDQSLLFSVYGVATQAQPPHRTITRQHMTTAHITMQAGAASTVSTSVQLNNLPEVLSAIWELDFSGDPLQVDLDGNGADWQLRGGGTIPAEHIVNGIWEMPSTQTWQLDTIPSNSFATEPITVDMRFRCNSIGGGGGYFWINADYTGGKYLPVVVELDLLNSSTQKLKVYTPGGDNYITYSGLAPDLVEVRLLIDPIHDTINVRVNDSDHGTFAYTRLTPAGDPQNATFDHWGSDMAIGHVRIAVGGTVH